jgi:hypothetical protein
MRSTTVLAGLSIPLLLLACNDHSSPITAPDAPALAAAAPRRAPLDPGHTYRFDFACGSAASAASSLMWILTETNIPRIGVTCNSFTEMGMENGTPFAQFGYEIAPEDGAAVCSNAGVTTTGTYRCKARKYTATLTVTDEGVVVP